MTKSIPEKARETVAGSAELMRMIYAEDLAGLIDWLKIASEGGELERPNNHLASYICTMFALWERGEIEEYNHLRGLASRYGHPKILRYYSSFSKYQRGNQR